MKTAEAIKSSSVIFVALMALACSSVPKETVELNSTIGRDVSAIRSAHLETVRLYYNRIEEEINEFIDEVYLPYTVNNLTREFGGEIFVMDSTTGKPVLDFELTKVLIEEISKEVENYRRSKLKPVRAQRDSVLSALDGAYQKIIYANSVVTGYLRSTVKVKDLQNELIAMAVPGNLGVEAGKQISEISEKISLLKKKIETKEENLENIIKEFEELIDLE
ncbi:hypothetical protein ACSSWA_05230 [Melioribacter sp. Ez-97]|uniref:hypothetical protein n=1 Tax=Melioribacter sp. Ez-97 TaxID=3423434 RepID=UPI003EDA67C1